MLIRSSKYSKRKCGFVHYGIYVILKLTIYKKKCAADFPEPGPAKNLLMKGLHSAHMLLTLDFVKDKLIKEIKSSEVVNEER